MKGLACYLAQYQLLPYERQQECFATVFQCKVSQGMLVKINQECFVQLAGVESQIKQALQNAPYLHADESGIKVDKALYWCHVASTSELTHYTIHPKRGKLGIAAAEVLPDFHGRLIHDFFRPYFSYDCQHALCNAHHLRELKCIEEVAKQEWAQYMAALLLAIKEQVEWHQGHHLPIPDHRIATYEGCYDEIIMMGLWHPDNLVLSNRKAGCGGYTKQTKAKNLLDRLRFHRTKVLAFLYDPNIPFTNNQAEQDIRMLKVKQKISGCFRSAEGSQWFARIRSYISTAKNNIKISYKS